MRLHQRSLPEPHRHGGVGHPSPLQTPRLHAVLSLVLEEDKAEDSRAILAEDVGHPWQPRVRKTISPGSHSLPASFLPSTQGRGKEHLCGQDLNPESRGSSLIGLRGHVVLGNDHVAGEGEIEEQPGLEGTHPADP